MKLSISTVLMAAVVAIVGAVEANGQVVFLDTFDADPTNGATRVLSIDNSATNGQFPSSFFDVFGIVDRNVNFDFSDDSVELANDGDPTTNDTFGIFSPEKTDMFLGFADTTNGDNLDGDVSVTWTVAVNGQTDLELSFDVAAMGDFEGADLLTFSASFDGGAATVVAEGMGSDMDPFTYTLDNGELAIAPFQTEANIPDPFVFGDTVIINELQTLAFPISGTGTELTLTLDYVTNGTGEPLAIDNVQVAVGDGDGGVVGLPGDLNGDGIVDCADADEFVGNIGQAATGALASFDLVADGTVDLLDAQSLIEDLAVDSNGVTGTFVGDLNCDGEVNVLGDAFVLVGSLGQSGLVYTDGDLDFDGDVDVLGDAFVLVGNLGLSN